MSENQAKAMFLRWLERSLNLAVQCLGDTVDAIVDHEVFAEEINGITNQLEACLRDLRAIRAAIGDLADGSGEQFNDMADELWGDPC